VSETEDMSICYQVQPETQSCSFKKYKESKRRQTKYAFLLLNIVFRENMTSGRTA
jgi:hypothetical protein